MEKWENWGDTNFADYGGILLSRRDDGTTFDVIVVGVIPVYCGENERYLFQEGIVDVQLFKEMYDKIGWGDPYDEVKDKANVLVDLVDYYGLEELDSYATPDTISRDELENILSQLHLD